MTASPPAPRLPPCPICQGQQVGNLGVVSQYGVGVHPHARALWAKPLSGLNAVVCLNCGHATLFAAEPAKLRQEAQQHPERFSW